MNHFFALEVPDEVRHEIAEQVNRWHSELNQFMKFVSWRSSNPRDQWVEPQDYHITLKFLGDISDAAVQRAIENAQPVADARQPFRIRLAKPGSFRRFHLWMGVRHDPDLEELAQALDVSVPHPNTLGPFGLPHTISSQQQYKPHITIARNIGAPEQDGYHLLYERPFPSWQVNRFVLMQTLPPEQRANGAKARYNIVQTFPFGNAHL